MLQRILAAVMSLGMCAYFLHLGHEVIACIWATSIGTNVMAAVYEAFED